MTKEEIIRLCKKEEDLPLPSLDLSYITAPGRMDTDSVPWDFYALVVQHTHERTYMLAMQAGGGEFLLSLPQLPYYTYATEDDASNVDLIRMRLAPQGVRVFKTQSPQEIPMDDDSLELVVNQHSAFDAAEVFRVLRPGGVFIAEQTGGNDALEINQWLRIRHPGDFAMWNLTKARQELEAAGLRVLAMQESVLYSRFYDVGAVVHYTRVFGWQFPGFRVDGRIDELCQVQKTIETYGFVACRAPRFVFLAQKPIG